jgi:hypothetical protein
MEENRNAYKFLKEILKETEHFEDLHMDAMISKCILEKVDGRV